MKNAGNFIVIILAVAAGLAFVWRSFGFDHGSDWEKLDRTNLAMIVCVAVALGAGLGWALNWGLS